MKKYWPWLLVAIPVFVFLSSLPFKFSNAPDTQHIFTTIGDWIASIGFVKLGALFGDVGGYVIGAFELIAALMLLLPKTRLYGALLGAGLLSGAIFFHLFTPLGVAVQFPGATNGDPSLFIMAVLSWLSCVTIVYLSRARQTPDAAAA